ncbi:MAG TPA: hypothetical protein VIW68_13780 [Candidatus Sulfotelmatobacter sp.]
MGLKKRNSSRLSVASILLAPLLLFLMAARFQENISATFAASQEKSIAKSAEKCGPGGYCARSDRKVEPYPKTPPAPGHAGSIITDPTFGSRIVRATDARDDARARSLMSPASAEQNSWNSTSTSFYVVTAGGGTLLYDFVPSTLSIHLRKGPAGWRGEPQFSFSHANLLFGVSSDRPELEQYDLSTGKVSAVDNPSRCLKLHSADLAFDVSVSADDSRFMSVIGPRQNANYLIYVHDRDKGCRWYNTQTGEIGGEWGPAGKIATGEGYGIHNARISKSGRFVSIARGMGGAGKWRIWDVDTLNVTACTTNCSGHRAMGYSSLLNMGGNHPFQMLKRPLDHLDSPSPLVSDLAGSPGYWYDSHISWNNVDASDTAPACLSTYRPSNPATPGTPLDVSGPWENEILCVQTDGKGSKVWRFAHTFSTAKNGFWSTPRGNVSQDGHFYMFTSDWEDQLGPLPNGKYRTDVFIVELH